MTFAEGDEIVAAVLPARIVNSAAQSPVAKAMPTTPENVDQYRNQSLRTFLRNREREYMEYVLTSANGDKEKAAKTLKISMATLYRKMPERKTPGK
jgi:transcriptional regulator with PAS, ATPase and Fis domain